MTESPELVTIQKYAAMNRLSIHTVVKKTMNGELPTQTQEKEGKEVTYIVLTPSDSKTNTEMPAADPLSDDEIEIDYKREYEALHREHLILKTKYEKLLQAHQN